MKNNNNNEWLCKEKEIKGTVKCKYKKHVIIWMNIFMGLGNASPLESSKFAEVHHPYLRRTLLVGDLTM